MNSESIFQACILGGFIPFKASYRELDGSIFLMGQYQGESVLLICGSLPSGFKGESVELGTLSSILCRSTPENIRALQRFFPYTVPSSPRGHAMTIGLGDRLGLITGAHIQALAGSRAFPVLAQQSKRELSLTGRSNREMLDSVAWQVFESGYEGGYAADGDHLKTLEEVQSAIDDGDTMITLDCSEHINNTAAFISPEEAGKQCGMFFPSRLLKQWNSSYAGNHIPLDKHYEIYFSQNMLNTLYLMYGNMIDFVERVYKEVIQTCHHPVSLEISIDETVVETTPAAHYFVASELLKRGVFFDSIAPRFCGEFQKGIDYVGDINAFQFMFSIHAQIAVKLGYKISVHSGSDKFSIFPIVSQLSGGKFHLKTSGTSWVEAVRVIAACNPELFRRMLSFSCAKYKEAKSFYHVSGLTERIPPLTSLLDKELPAMLDNIDVRQVIHITYGFLLQQHTPEGTYLFREEIYKTLRSHQEELNQTIIAHIRRHLQALDAF